MLHDKKKVVEWKSIRRLNHLKMNTADFEQTRTVIINYYKSRSMVH